MSVIEATAGTYRSRVDGTLVLSVEIEPRHVPDALKLFGTPGAPMALARLVVGAGAEPEPPAERVGPLCYWAVQRCKEPHFRVWFVNKITATEEDAKRAIYALCDIKSRKELDTNADAADLFNEHVRRPYMKAFP
jgi:hypothetical protein